MNPDCTYHVVGTQRDDHAQYARTDGTRAFTGTVTATSFTATADDAAWIAVVGGIGFTNTWTNVGGADLVAGYRKVNGRIYLRGTIQSGVSGINTSAFTLPAAYRPSATANFACGQVAGNIVNPYVTIASAGTVTINGNSGSTATVGLDTISFDTL